MRIDWVKMENARDYANKNIKTKCKKKSFWLWKKERNLTFSFISFSSTPKFCPCWGPPGDAAFDPPTFSLFYFVLSYILFILFGPFLYCFYFIWSFPIFVLETSGKEYYWTWFFLWIKKKERKNYFIRWKTYSNYSAFYIILPWFYFLCFFNMRLWCNVFLIDFIFF